MKHEESLNVSADGELDIVITRSFAANRARVFEAITRADQLKLWLVGPPGWTMTVCEVDFRVGGKFRHEWRGPGDEQMAMGGTYRAIEAPESVVRTESFEFGCESQGGEQLANLTLEEQGGGSVTRLRIVVRYPTKEARDGALASGMEQGLHASYGRLDGELTRLVR